MPQTLNTPVCVGCFDIRFAYTYNEDWIEKPIRKKIIES